MKGTPKRQFRHKEGSLTSKLLTLLPGETVYLDDAREEPGARPLAGAVRAAMVNAKALPERRFSTSRWTAVQTSPARARPILAITRVDTIEMSEPAGEGDRSSRSSSGSSPRTKRNQ